MSIKEEDGMVRDVILGLPAANAGVGPGMTIVAVNGRRFTPELLRTAITEAKNGSTPIELLVENGGFFRTHSVDYHGGLRSPHLVRVEGKEDRLAAVLKARAK
jgi:predicted metalloprotease with PDZ domain